MEGHMPLINREKSNFGKFRKKKNKVLTYIYTAYKTLIFNKNTSRQRCVFLLRKNLAPNLCTFAIEIKQEHHEKVQVH